LSSYLETSFLVSLYAADVNSPAAAAYIGHASGPFPLTSFCELELSNAIQLRVFRREITPGQAKAAMANVATDVSSGMFSVVATPVAVYETAQQLVRTQTANLGVRTLDILHVAAALVLKADGFYTFDRRQAQWARVAGLAAPVAFRSRARQAVFRDTPHRTITS
jgi:predicted nucleic acid-binding protein